jgi:hypothetical protein
MSNDTMTLWADVLDASETSVGTGPIPLISASVTRLIDGSGGIKCDCMADVKGRETLVSGRRIKIWCDIEGVSRLMGEGYISKVGLNESKLGISGNDLLEELKWSNTLRNYQVNGETVQEAISDLVAADGWTVEASGSATSTTITLPFENETRLKALLSVAEAGRVHVRVATRGNRILEVGDFGTDGGITLFDASAGAGGDEWSGILESLTVEEQSDQITNRILPTGGQFESEPKVTLEDSTRSGVSTIAGQDAALNYYVGHEESEALYGIRYLPKSYPDIKPLSASAGDRIAASNQLYDIAYADLIKLAYLRRNYKGKARGLRGPLNPGDLIRVLYNAPIYMDDGSLWPGGALDEYLYVNRVEEYAGEGGTWQNVDLSYVNGQRIDEATDVAISVERSKKA